MPVGSPFAIGRLLGVAADVCLVFCGLRDVLFVSVDNCVSGGVHERRTVDCPGQNACLER